jgi:hypothetical protein
MTRSILAVIRDLEEHVDAKHTATSNQERPIERSSTELVVCVAGRGPFDDVVSAMLAQLLAQRGVGSRRIPHTSVSRELIAQLDLSTAKVIAVSYLELGGAPAHLRYLLRRLRHRAPHAAIIAGLWPKGEAVLNEPETQKTLDGDRYVGSMREAVDATLAVLSDPPASKDLARRIGSAEAALSPDT